MFIRKKPLYNKKISLQICENRRENGKTLQRVLTHVGTADKDDVEAIEKLSHAATFLKKELENENRKKELTTAPELPFTIHENKLSSKPLLVEMPPQHKVDEDDREHHWVDTAKLIERARVVDGIHAIFGTILDKFGLETILGRRQYNMLRNIIMARIAWPSSKLRASENLAKHFNVDLPVHKIYRLMDALEEQSSTVQAALFNALRPLIGEKVEVLFFDVTTLYIESEDEDELRRFGFSKDQKTHLTQVVLALATTQDGLPIGYKLFPGNTAETSTLLQAITEWRNMMNIEQVTIIADRAMMSEANMKLLEESQLKYVIAAKLKALPKRLQETILSRTNERVIFHNDEETVTVQEHNYEGRRLIVSHNTKRARKDARDREQILKKLKARIGEKGSTKKLVTNRGYLAVVSEEGNSEVTIDEVKVAAVARWDGLHGVLTNLSEINHEQILALYRRLWVIEESFRVNKHTLEMRPIYHYVSRRIQAHILISYIAFTLCRYVQKRIAMQQEQMSIERIRSALIDVQHSILQHEDTQCMYRLPSKMPTEARCIYGVFNVKRDKYITKVWCLN